MEYRCLPNGSLIPALGLGTWGYGGLRERDEALREPSREALRVAIELGYRLIDSAEIYAAGLAEELIGEALRGQSREEFFLCSKFWSYKRSSEVIAAVQASLRRLRVEYLDICFAHREPEGEAWEEVIGAMVQVVEQGMAHFVGVSNFSISALKRAHHELGGRLVCVQSDLQLNGLEGEILDYCRNKGLLFMASRPIRKNRLLQRASVLLSELSAKYGKTPHQLALRFVLQQPNSSAIPKSLSRGHLEENLGALGWQLEEGDFVTLQALFSKDTI